LLDNFDDRYLGPKSSAPALDNDGNALVIGALYYDTTTAKMRVYTASGWIDASSASVATLGQFQFNATGGQTTFSGTAAVGGSLAYTVGAVLVALNGVLLEETSDFTASNGSSIVLTSAAASGDELNVYAFGNFLVADTYTQAAADARFLNSAGDTMTGALNMDPNVSFLMRAGDGTTGSNMFHYSVDNHTYYDNIKGGDQVFRGGAGYTERVRITNGGIKFPTSQNASSDPNTLDDYEEGTWSPELRPSSGGSYNWLSQKGRYVKIGKLVTLHGFVQFDIVGGAGSGQMYLQNFPFTSINSGDLSANSSVSIGRSGGWSGTHPVCGAIVSQTGATAAELYQRTSATSASSDLPASSMTSYAYVSFSITYTTNS
jgi:hypothetical protein